MFLNGGELDLSARSSDLRDTIEHEKRGVAEQTMDPSAEVGERFRLEQNHAHGAHLLRVLAHN